MIYQLFSIWCKSFAVLWMLWGVSIYLDQHRSTIRRHGASLKMMSLKFGLAPLTLCYVAGLIAIQPLLLLHRNFTIGCYTGRGGPPIPPGLRGFNRRVAENLEANDLEKSLAWEREQLILYGNVEYIDKVNSPLSCREATVRNELALRPGTNTKDRTRVVSDDEHAERYNTRPEDEADD